MKKMSEDNMKYNKHFYITCTNGRHVICAPSDPKYEYKIGDACSVGIIQEIREITVEEVKKIMKG